MKTIIVDWAGNILSHDGIFKSKSFAVPKTFKDFDDAEEYLCGMFDVRGLDYEVERGEYYIEQVKQ